MDVSAGLALAARVLAESGQPPKGCLDHGECLGRNHFLSYLVAASQTAGLYPADVPRALGAGGFAFFRDRAGFQRAPAARLDVARLHAESAGLDGGCSRSRAPSVWRLCAGGVEISGGSRCGRSGSFGVAWAAIFTRPLRCWCGCLRTAESPVYCRQYTFAGNPPQKQPDAQTIGRRLAGELSVRRRAGLLGPTAARSAVLCASGHFFDQPALFRRDAVEPGAVRVSGQPRALR